MARLFHEFAKESSLNGFLLRNHNDELFNETFITSS